MENNEIKMILMKTLSLQVIHVNGYDKNFDIIAVSEMFIGINRVKQQQMIYAPLIKYFVEKRIHALNIKTYTPQEWININNEKKEIKN